MDTDIESFAKFYISCKAVKSVPLHHGCGQLNCGSTYMWISQDCSRARCSFLIDKHSKWLEIFLMKSTIMEDTTVV